MFLIKKYRSTLIWLSFLRVCFIFIADKNSFFFLYFEVVFIAIKAPSECGRIGPAIPASIFWKG